MTLYSQNTILPHLGSDIRPAQPEPAMKWVMDANDNWTRVPYVRTAAGDYPASIPQAEQRTK